MSIAQAPLSGGTAALIGVAALGAIVFDAGWRVVRHFTVMAHEGAHAVIGFLLFREVRGIELHADATGGTDIVPATGLRGIPIALAGYLGPSAFGLGAAKLIELRYTTLVLWVALFLLAVLLVGLRRWPPARPVVPAVAGRHPGRGRRRRPPADHAGLNRS